MNLTARIYGGQTELVSRLLCFDFQETRPVKMSARTPRRNEELGMKASNVSVNERAYLEMKQRIYDDVKRDVEQVLRDREMMAGCRAQWMLLVALYRKFGFGQKRLKAVMLEIETMLENLYEDRQAEVMDETLILDLERLGLDIKATHGEYFECAERLKSFGRFIDKEKDKAKAEAKEKELLKKLNINIKMNMKGRKLL